MARFYDEVLDYAYRLPDGKSVVEALRSAMVISGDNVARYYFMENPKEDLDLTKDFPNVAPPFENIWLDFRAPSHTYSREDGLQKWEGMYAWGVYLIVKDRLTNGGWDVEGWMFAKPDRHSDPQFGVKFAMLVNEDGSLWFHPTDGPRVGENAGQPGIFIHHAGRFPDSEVAIQWMTDHHMYLYAALLTLSFMHCKNVAQHIEQPPDWQQMARRKKHKRPLVTYRVLEIEPMKQVLRTEGQSEKTGLQRALHICRGHFKTYDDKPLFGKVKGTFWWPSAVRGSIKEGIALKDYAVKAAQ